MEKADLREIRSSVLASGQLAYREAIVLSPEVIGKVSAILVRDGQHVAQGEPLLQLDDHSLQAEVAEQRAAVRQQSIVIEQQELALRNQQAQFGRKRELHDKGMIADAALDDARFALDSADIELRNSRLRREQATAVLSQSEERLAKATVRAPIAGTVIGLDIRIGETAVPSQVGIPGSNLLTIANTGTMMAEIDVDEADIPRVSSGQAVMLHPTAFPDRTIVGRVASIALSPKRGPQGEAQGLHYNVRVSLPDATPLPLRTGMRCRAEIDTGQRTKVLAVPIHALLMADDEAARHHVFVDVAGKAERRDVTVGLSDDSQQQILSGLAKGDVVVTGPYRTLRALQPGDSIAPEKKTP